VPIFFYVVRRIFKAPPGAANVHKISSDKPSLPHTEEH